MNIQKKATPWTVTGTRQSHSTPHSTLIAAIVPQSRLAPDYIVLAVLLYSPELADPFISRLHAGHWESDLHRVVARIALSHLSAYGRVDLFQLANVLNDYDKSLSMELATLRCVSDLIHPESLMGDAVAILTGHRRDVAA